MSGKTNKTTKRAVGVFSDKQLTTAVQEKIVSLMSKKGGDNVKWTGTMTDLMRAIRRIGSSQKVTLPTSPSVMRRVINNAVYGLRRSGVSVKFSRTTDHMRKRVVEFVQR